jgi:hypothetical protein
MPKASLRMTPWVIVEIEYRLGTEAIGVLLCMVGEGMMSPMLRHPIPLAPTDKISTKSK